MATTWMARRRRPAPSAAQRPTRCRAPVWLTMAATPKPRFIRANRRPGECSSAEKPGDLLEHNYLILNLNPPLALKDTAWIKPGKAMRDTTLTTANSKAIIDFAATAGL